MQRSKLRMRRAAREQERPLSECREPGAGKPWGRGGFDSWFGLPTLANGELRESGTARDRSGPYGRAPRYNLSLYTIDTSNMLSLVALSWAICDDKYDEFTCSKSCSKTAFLCNKQCSLEWRRSRRPWNCSHQCQLQEQPAKALERCRLVAH